MKRTLFIPAVIIVLLVGCRPEENPDQLKAVNQSLEYANGVMQEANNLVYYDLNSKAKDPTTAMVVAVWNSSVQRIRQNADSIKALIRDVKLELIKQSDSLKRDYVDVTKQLHSTDGVGQQLLNKLTMFRDSIRVIISLNKKDRTYSYNVINQLLQTVPLLSGYRDSLTADQKGNYEKKWLEESFGHSSSLMAMIMLNKLESDVLSTEKTFIDYCNSQMAIENVIYDKHTVIASLNSSYAKAGQPIELTVGMGSFTDDLNPRITIDGKELKLNDDGVVIHKFIANGLPGSHVIPVKVEYTEPDGSKEVVEKYLEYIIAEN